MVKKFDIHKAGGIIIRERQLLLLRSAGKDVFVAPGGKLEPGESPEVALKRELNEELDISIDITQLTFFGTYSAPASGRADLWLQMEVFMVPRWDGKLRIDSEIEEMRWVSCADVLNMKVGSIFQYEIIPKLKERNLIN